MRANGYTLTEAKWGAHLNNMFFGIGVFDSDADQRAIQNGYYYMNNLILTWKRK
jgi:hypothetical protein